jgi:hypothetical protein
MDAGDHLIGQVIAVFEIGLASRTGKADHGQHPPLGLCPLGAWALLERLIFFYRPANDLASTVELDFNPGAAVSPFRLFFRFSEIP